MGTAYSSRKDVALRLSGTVCFYDGLPYYVVVDEFRTDDKVSLYRFADVGNGIVSLTADYTDPKFSYKSPCLGYYFHKKKQAVYISRVPDRNQSQGLSQHVLHTQPELHKYERWYHSQEFEDMLLGRYPGRATAESLLASGMATSVPISRNVAIAHSRRGLLEIYYKGRPVACNLKGRGIELYDLNEANYLAKLLARDGVLLN